MRNPRLHLLPVVLALWIVAPAAPAFADFFGRPATPMRSASELLRRQDAPKVFKAVEPLINPANSRMTVSISKQRAYLMTGDQVYIDTPISSGKRAGMTPTGSFSVMEKDPDHRSNIYGAFCDPSGRIVREGVSLKIDSAPSGTHYVGAPMKWFMRLSDRGVGMHIGILPGYPASHGCVRLPADIAGLIYQKVKVGTPVTIEQ